MGPPAILISYPHSDVCILIPIQWPAHIHSREDNFYYFICLGLFTPNLTANNLLFLQNQTSRYDNQYKSSLGPHLSQI